MIKRFIPVFMLFVFQATAQLQPPYITSCKPVNDSTISVTWRNNDLTALFLYVYIRSASQEKFLYLDSVNGTQTTYSITHLNASTKYYFQLTAGDNANISEGSNIDSATTYKLVEKRIGPRLTVKYTPGSSSNSVYIYDSSNCEKKIQLYLSHDTISDTVTIIPDKPKAFSTYHFTFDSLFDTLLSNTWYNINVTAFFDTTIKIGGGYTLFTLNSDLLYNTPKHIRAYRQEIGTTPLVNPKWMMKTGDSVLIRESNAPGNSVSVIDISYPLEPKFKGYRTFSNGDLFSSSDYYCLDKNLYCLSAKYFKCYRYENGDFKLVNIVELPETDKHYFYGSKNKNIIYQIDHGNDTYYDLKAVNVNASPMTAPIIVKLESAVASINMHILEPLIFIRNQPDEMVDLRYSNSSRTRALTLDGNYAVEYTKLRKMLDTTSKYDSYLINGTGGMLSFDTTRTSAGYMRIDTFKVLLSYDSLSGLIYRANSKKLSIYSTEPSVTIKRKIPLVLSQSPKLNMSGKWLHISGVSSLKYVEIYNLNGKCVLKYIDELNRGKNYRVDISKLSEQAYVVKLTSSKSVHSLLFNNCNRF